jgi:hypothetical protein
MLEGHSVIRAEARKGPKVCSAAKAVDFGPHQRRFELNAALITIDPNDCSEGLGRLNSHVYFLAFRG